VTAPLCGVRCMCAAWSRARAAARALVPPVSIRSAMSCNVAHQRVVATTALHTSIVRVLYLHRPRLSSLCSVILSACIDVMSCDERIAASLPMNAAREVHSSAQAGMQRVDVAMADALDAQPLATFSVFSLITLPHQRRQTTAVLPSHHCIDSVQYVPSHASHYDVCCKQVRLRRAHPAYTTSAHTPYTNAHRHQPSTLPLWQQHTGARDRARSPTPSHPARQLRRRQRCRRKPHQTP
jgi:hypothetical protein